MSDLQDLQMARGAVEGGWNLAIGEPVALQEHLRFPVFETQGPFQYPTMEGDPNLVEELQKFHPGHHVVIANGAKQALLAAFYAFKETEGKTWVHHYAPYWPSYPTLAKLSKLMFFDGPDWDRPAPLSHKISCSTSPNNPDGSQLLRSRAAAVDVWDAVYAHGLYGWNGVEPEYRVRIGSAAKLLGLSGARVGWLVTREPKLAEYARRYVEFTTSGVSLVSQEYVVGAFRQMRTIEAGRAVGDARGDMIVNGRAFMHRLGEYCAVVRGFPTEREGMFAYFAIKNGSIGAFEKAIDRAKVLLVTGEACGEPARGWWRMNMAQRPDYTEAALKALSEELKRVI